ncbi:hypothetical protein GS397_05945 [Sphingobium yanoikuyae]|uniref:Poly-beta-hydroxybutyrate polymerase N-terminal domain-containing protein n=2 Tax=Sphingobium TaxID=165695 RepID=A0A6P1GE16_SPHYA|nr:hypothetical protein GS397_05945 [Sphingobium yanoikuyae]
MAAGALMHVPAPLDRIAESLHRTVVAAVTRMTSGLSPTTLDKALTDWSHHFAFSPGKSPQLDGQAGGNIAPLFGHLIRSAHQRDAAPAIEPHPQDRGFSDSACARPSPSVPLLITGATNPWSIVPSLMAKPSPLSVRRSSEDLHDAAQRG